MGLRLQWRGATSLPVEAGGLLPVAVEGLSPADVSRLRLPVGNTTAELGELFEVADSPSDDAPDLTFSGDLGHVRGLCRGLDRGTVVVEGPCGPFVGAGMTGGTVEVRGDAGDYAGAGMAGGLLRVVGNAGRGLGSALPGDRHGMREGLIVVTGSAGDEAGHKMRRGVIAVAGPLGAYAGRAMIAGTVVALGSVGPYAGSGMKRGTVVIARGGDGPRLLPTFEPTGAYRFPFLSVYFRALEGAGLVVPGRLSSSEFERYNGDLAEGGRGEILVGPAGDLG